MRDYSVIENIQKKGYAQKVAYDGVLHSADEMDRSITIACKRYAQISREDREIETHTQTEKQRKRLTKKE